MFGQSTGNGVSGQTFPTLFSFFPTVFVSLSSMAYKDQKSYLVKVDGGDQK